MQTKLKVCYLILLPNKIERLESCLWLFSPPQLTSAKIGQLFLSALIDLKNQHIYRIKKIK